MKKSFLLVLSIVLSLSIATGCSSGSAMPISQFLPLIPTLTPVPSSPEPTTQHAMPVFVPPFYNWDGTQIYVGNYSDRLATEDLQELTILEKEMADRKSELRPEQMFVLAIRLYDLGMKNDSVYWFYEAQFRQKLFLKTLESKHVGFTGAPSYELLQHYGAFVKLAGQYINGYAGCDIDNWMQIAEKVQQDNPNPPALDKLFPDAIFVERSQWQGINDQVAAGLGGLIDQLSQQKDAIKKQRAADNSDARFAHNLSLQEPGIETRPGCSTMEHNRIVRREFSKQAHQFEQKGLTLSNLEIMDWIVSRLPLEKEFRVLDVAAGTGLLSRALAPQVKEVMAIDITPGMIKYAYLETSKNKLNNISILEGNAEELPYAANSFDLVVSRLAIHHFETPMMQMREMVRVCKPGRNVAIVDLLAPEEEGVAKSYNDLERLRDPSHVEALSQPRMEQLLTNVGLTLESIETRDVEADFQRWVQMTETNPETVQRLQEKLLNDIGDHSETGMRPFMKDSVLKFLQVWSMLIGSK